MTSPTTDRRQGLVGNTAYKAPVACVAVGPITLSGEQIVDGMQTSASRVLVAGQANTSDNGIYDSSSAAWTRSADADGNYDLTQGSQVAVAGGTLAATVWRLLSALTSIGSSPQIWAQPTAPLTYITPDSLGAIGDGVHDDTTAWNLSLSVLAALGGGVLSLRSNKTYKLTSRVKIPSRVSVMGDSTQTVLAPAASFNNTSLTAKYQDNSVVLDISGQTVAPFTPSSKITLAGFSIVSEVLDGRFLDAVVGRNCSDCRIELLDISGFPVGRGICIASWNRGFVERNYIHDFTSNAVWATQPQITGIEIDNDRINGVGTSGTSISRNSVSRLTVGPVIILGNGTSTAWGYQTDCINPCNPSVNRCSIDHNIIDTVGEGIDHFGSYCNLDGNILTNCYIFGLKFIHGASFNTGHGIVINNAGLAGVVFAGSSTDGDKDTERNTLTSLTVTTINYNGVWTLNTNACILFEDNGGANGKPKNNTVSCAILSEGATGKYGWFDGSTGGNNYGCDISIQAAAANVARIDVQHGTGSCRMVGDATFYTSLV